MQDKGTKYTWATFKFYKNKVRDKRKQLIIKYEQKPSSTKHFLHNNFFYKYAPKRTVKA